MHVTLTTTWVKVMRLNKVDIGPRPQTAPRTLVTFYREFF